MVHLLELIFFILILKAILRCLYFWQLKEYRWDRFRQFLKTAQARQYFLPTRYFLRPRLTLKIIFLIYLVFYFTISILRLPNLIIVPFAAYLTIPFSTSLAVLLLSPITSLIKDLIILLAKLKIRTMPSSLKVIGITGSYAKTSVKEILAHLLTTKYQVCKTQGTDNTLIGVAKTILKNLHKSHQIFIVEMGAYKSGEIKQICRLVKPSIGIFTGITQQHLSLFGSLEKIIAAKYELIQALPKTGLAVFNGQDPQVLKLARQTKHLKKLIYNKPKKNYNTNLIGQYQQMNLQAAITVAQSLKIPQKTIKSKLTTIPNFKTAITIKPGLNQATIINDTYNANPQGFQAAINLVKQKNFKQKILITSGIIELGQESQAIHQNIYQQAQPVFDLIYITKPEIKPVFKKAVYQPDFKKLLHDLKPKLNSTTLVLLASRLPQKFIKNLCVNPS